MREIFVKPVMTRRVRAQSVVYGEGIAEPINQLVPITSARAIWSSAGNVVFPNAIGAKDAIADTSASTWVFSNILLSAV